MKTCRGCAKTFDSPDWSCPHCGNKPEEIDGVPYLSPAQANDDEGFPTELFGDLFELEASNFWFRSRNELIIWALKKFFPQAENFLELGCGTGYVLTSLQKSLPKLQVSGSEIYKRGIDQARRRVPATKLMQLDAREMPFQQEFDVVGAFDVLEHIKEDELVLTQINKALKGKGSGLILTVPQHKFLWSALDEVAHHERRYEREELESKLRSAGFKLVKITSFVSLLLPLMLASRLTKTKKAEDICIEDELRLPRPIDKALSAVQRLERKAIRTGLSFPTGGSLLAVAEKIT